MAAITAKHVRGALAVGFVAGSMAIACASSATAQEAPTSSPPVGPWFVQVTPYAWLPSVSGSTRATRRVPSLSVDKSFSDILSDLDFAAMVVGTVRYERFGLLVDLDYISLGVDGHLSGPAKTKYSTDLKALLATVGATARVVDEPELGVDLLVGARIMSMWIDGDLKGQGPFEWSRSFDNSATIVDGLVGIRADVGLGDGFSLVGYADIGAGNSDLTWQVLGAVRYDFSNSVSGAIGYRYLGYDFGGHAPLDDLALYGPIAGITIRF